MICGPTAADVKDEKTAVVFHATCHALAPPVVTTVCMQTVALAILANCLRAKIIMSALNPEPRESCPCRIQRGLALEAGHAP